MKQFLAARLPQTSSSSSSEIFPSSAPHHLSRASSLPPSLHTPLPPAPLPISFGGQQPHQYNPAFSPAPVSAPPRTHYHRHSTADDSFISSPPPGAATTKSSSNNELDWGPSPIPRQRSDSELAATGRRGGGATPTSQHFDSPPHHHQVFSNLMQTDDVSSIAEQIASQAELIYQTWKTTGLNPNQLIRYHSIATESGDEVDSGSSSSARAVTPVPRTPGRSISPAPPGSSPAVPRRVIDSALTNGRQQQLQQQHHSPKIYSQHSGQQQHSAYQQKDHPLSSSQYQQNYSNQQHYPTNQHIQQVQNQSQHASSPVRTLNASPRPYISPGGQPISPPSRSPATSPPNLGNYSSHSSSPSAFISSPPLSPPQPPERSSSYTGSDSPGGDNLQILSDPKLEVSLRDLVNTFVLEDKARQGFSSRLNERPKSAPSSIQDALQRFERQMAITSRTVPPSLNENTVQI